MSGNPYLQLLDEEESRVATTDTATSAPAKNPYLDTLNAEETQRRAVLRSATAVNPEAAAVANNLARARNLPPELVMRNLEEIKRQELVEDGVRRFSVSPALSDRMRDIGFAQVAHDDLPTLSGIEQAIRTLKSAPSAVASSVPRASAGLWGLAAAAFEVPGQAFRAAENLLSDLMGAPRGSAGRNVGEIAGSFLRNEQRASEGIAGRIYTAPTDAGIIERGVGSGLQSAAQTLLTLPIALRQGGETAALAVMGSITGGSSYGKARDKGLTPASAAVYGAQDAVAEVVTERFALGKLLGDIKAGSGAGKMLVSNLLREIPGELAATTWQSFNEWLNLNPDKAVSEWVNELPEQLAETFVATLVGGTAQNGAIQGAQKIAGKLSGETAQAQEAERRAGMLEQINKLGAASKVAGRDAVTYKQLIADIAEEEGEAPTEFYIDGQTLVNSLNQSGMTMQELQALAPTVAQQLNAAEVGGDIRVPVSEFMAAGEELTAPLVDHMRIGDPNAPTRLEAKDIVKNETEAMRAAVDEFASKQADQDTFRQSIENVRTQFETELNTAKRFTPAVNKAYSELLANFYGATASRLGMTPEALLDKYKLRVQAQGVAGERTLNQGPQYPLAPPGTRYEETDIAPTMMSPDEFLARVRPLEIDEASRDNIDDLKAHIKSGRTLDPLHIRKDGKEDGRHRAIAAKELGIQQIPVIDEQRTALNQAAKAAPEIRQTATGFEAYIDGKRVGRLESNLTPEQSKQLNEPASVDIVKVDKELQGQGVGSALYAAFNQAHEGRIAPSGKTTAQAWAVWKRNFPEKVAEFAKQEAARIEGGASRELVLGNITDAQVREAVANGGVYEARTLNQSATGQEARRLALREKHKETGITFADASIDRDGAHSPSGPEDGSPAYDVALNGTYPEDFYGSKGLQYYGTGEAKMDAEMYAHLSRMAGRPNAPITVYRAVEKDGAKKIGPGDWVTPIRAYAKDHGEGALNGEYKIIKAEVHARDIWTSGDSMLEWGYHPQPFLPEVRLQDDGQYNQGEDTPRAQISFAEDITKAPSVISLLKGADLSSFLHESGHLFLEIQSDLAVKIQQQIDSGASVSELERGIVEDMNKLLEWFGVKGSESLSPLDEWATMTLEQKREHHETFARGFERYSMEGKAPSLALQGIFSRFRAWLTQVYKTLKGLNVELTDDVRGVMDRMLATDQAIEEAEAARNMGPLFKTAEEGSKYGMTLEQYNALHSLSEEARAEAVSKMDARLLADMKWLSRAKDKALKARQAEVDDLRSAIQRDVRAEVMAEPIYRAWQFLTMRAEKQDTAQGSKPVTSGKAIDLTRDNLFAAIAKRGGLNRDEVTRAWGVDPKDKLESGVFGMPVVRKDGGKSLDSMLESLVEDGYLTPDENGKGDPASLEEAFDAQRRGVDQFSAWKYTSGEDVAQALPGELFAGKLNTDMLRDQYGTREDAVWRKLSARRMTSDKGIAPDVVAEKFGFDSGDALVKQLAEAMPPQEVIDARTDQRMLEENGDINSPEALDRAADEAIHNEVRARFIATEMKALEAETKVTERRGKSTVNLLARAAKDYAYSIIAGQRIRDLRPSQYAAAEARNSKLAEKALASGKREEAAAHKRNQLVNNYATRAAYDAQEEVRSAQKYFRKFDKRSKTIDAEYQDQIEQMLERFDFKPVSLKEVDSRKSLSKWYADQVAMGVEPSIPDQLLNEANRKSYKDMTVEEIRGMRETIEQMEHLGRLKNRLLLARDQKDFDAAASEMAASIIEHGGKARPVSLEGPNPVVDWFAGVTAQHRKLASLFREMDGNKDAGPMYELIGRGMNERGTMEDTMVEKATVALRELYAPLLKMKGGITGYRSKVFIPEINASLTRGGRLSVALNWGNEANRQRIMDGDKWSEGQVRAIIKTLSPAELQFVNGMWQYLDSFWPEIAAKEKRLTGVEPEKVEAAPFNAIASDGTEVPMRGGYYPLKYDTDRSDRADQQEAAQAAKEMMQGAFTRATTRRGHTKERLQEVKRAVRKDLNVITQHITQVTHDLAWHEWLIDTNKLLADERVVSAVRDHYGPRVLKTMRDDVMGIATADVAPQTAVDTALLKLRSNVTRATMGASVTTAFLQPFGLTQSMVRIGPKHVLRGLARWGGDAARMESTVGWIKEKSEFMRLRSKTMNKELREIRGSVAGKSATMRVIDAGLFAMMQKMQLVADVPTWVGQYEKSLSEGLDEAAAVSMADRAVLESQGGGQTKDLAEVQRKHPMLTQFYSYFSVTLNLAAEQTAATSFKNPVAVAGWLGDMALLMVIPAILPSLIMFGLKGGDDDDEKGMAKRIAEWQLGYLLGTVVLARELSGAVGGFDYAGPPVGRLAGDLGKAGKQASQGELDEPAVMAIINLMGSALGIPTVQALRSYKGWKAWDEGQEGAGPQSVLFGPPPKK